MATYKTPDVYVEEISLFPPSVAEVETAIPAFIGYTEKAEEFTHNDLTEIPTRITSLLEYESFFGGAPPSDFQDIVLDENNAVSSYILNSNFYMYDTLRMFFKNGGGKCYIISVGSYSDTISKGNFETGLTKLKKKDEPTIILFPDAVRLESDDLYDLQQQALLQCNDLQDRFTVMDLLESKSTDPTFDWVNGYNDFRDKIGINYLKYGAAYTPWLKTNLGLNIHYRDIKGKVTRGGNIVTLEALTDNPEVKSIVTNLDNAIADVDKIDTDLATIKGNENTLKAKYTTLLDAFKGNRTTANFKALVTFIYDMVDSVDEWGGTNDPVAGNELKTIVSNLITNSLKVSMENLISYDKGADSELTTAYNLFTSYHPVECTVEWDNIFDENHANNPAANLAIFTGNTNAEKMTTAEPYITIIFNQINAAVTHLINAANGYETTYDDNLYEAHSVYKNMIIKLRNANSVLPPSGAIAGIYAMVDSNRGVWKAPANVSLSGVVGLTETIDSKEQEELNVDVVAGKSINAIRAFTGKGTLVWGARTLAGNDNEWRYVSVRRFFNMVEESVKKSTYWAVFEPNDANTWIKVKAMIENYLVQKWRDGALAGSTPDEAFFVKVGLGLTMTAQDILEGRMNVEIGMAVVRPAEFIVLKFSHKMQES